MEIVKDLDGHKYRLSKENAKDFNKLLGQIEKAKIATEEWYDLNAALDNLYGRFMIG